MPTSRDDDIRQGIENDRKIVRSTLAGVIAKIKEIGQDQYQGQVFDNIYAIFTQLDVTERRILLKGLINICFIVESEILTNGNTSLKEVKTAVEETGAAIHDEISTMEDFNTKEMIKMKNSITRTVIILLTVCIGIAFIVATVMSKNPLESFASYGESVRILAEIFGF